MSEPERLLATSPVTRRRFIQGSALAGFSAFLAACASGGGATTAPTPGAAPTEEGGTGALTGATWTAYI